MTAPEPPSSTTAEWKTRLEELAILGGRPAFEQTMHVGRPNIGDRARLMERIEDLLDRRWLTNDGPYTAEFERAMARKLNVRHFLAMCNGTIALEIAIRAAGLAGEVIVPAFTFIATAHALQWQEITPVFADVDPRSHTLDPEKVEQMITPRTTGIIGVHLWGRPCDIDALSAIARRHGLTLLFDAAHALGASYRGAMIGNFGLAEVFSFHATKFVNSFEGGAVATNDDELAQRVLLMRNFGFAGYDNVVYVGTNGKMSEVAAAMGLTSLEAIDEFTAANRRNHEAYRRALAGIPGIHLLQYPPNELSNYQYVIVEVSPQAAATTRDRLVEVLWAENVLARRYFHPAAHRMEPYRSFFPHARLLLPETERLSDRVMALPTGTSVDESDIEAIAQLIRVTVENATELERTLDRPPQGLSGTTRAAVAVEGYD